MPKAIPDLSRFELQCLRLLWTRGEASMREIHEDLGGRPTYSTVRKIFERMEQKGAVERIRLDGRAWIYRPAVSPPAVIRREVRRLIDGLFEGEGASLVAHLADTDEVTVEDLREIEARLRDGSGKEAKRRNRRSHG